jgi:HEAT repeat protein
MFGLRRRRKDQADVRPLVAVLTDETAASPGEVFRRCQAAEALSALGPTAGAAMPALIRTLVVPVSVDCVLALRVAAAEAVWKVGGRDDLALPFLAWALKDEYWGVSRKAAEVLGEMGPVAHETTPDLVRLGERRLTCGRFFFETFERAAATGPGPRPLLVVVATALGVCGRGPAHWQEAHAMLSRLASAGEDSVRTAAGQALISLGTLGPPDGVTPPLSC